MDLFFFFLVASVTLVILILQFDKKQTKKVNTILRETRSVPPLFLLKSTELKISTLKMALRYDDIPQNMASAASMASIYNNKSESNRQTKVQDLKILSAKYNNGQMSLEAYNLKLDDLLEQVNSLGGAFELAC